MGVKENTEPCPCGSGEALPDCCLPYIRKQQVAATAELLMRSRYCAYLLEHEQYLLNTWHPSTRPKSIRFDPAIKWVRLKVSETGAQADHVQFVATYKLNGKAHKLRENSRFIFEDGRWYYVEAV